MTEDLRAMKAGRWLLFATVLVPLVMWSGFFFPYVTTRTVFFRTVVELVVGVFIYLLATREHVAHARSDRFLWALLAFTVASGISAAVSPAPNRSMFGDFERMGGVWALLHFLMYYAMLRVFFRERDWRRFLQLSVFVSALVSALAVTQFWVTFAGSGLEGTFYSAVFATMGNAGLLGLYLFFGIGFAGYLAITSQGKWRAVYVVVALLDLYGVTLSQNRSTLLGITVALALGALGYSLFGRRRRKLVIGTAFGIAAIFSVGLTIAVKSPQTARALHLPGIFNRAAQTTLGGTDAIRFLQWKSAIEASTDRPLVGYGPENFHLAWSAHFQQALYGKITEERLDRAHNAFLEVLATTGLIGTVTFLLVWAALFYSIWSAARSRQISAIHFAFFLALFSGYVVCLIFWFLDINSVPPWIAACALAAFLTSGGPLVEFGPSRPVTRQSKILLGGGSLVLIAALWLHSFETLRIARVLYQTQIGNPNISETLHRYFQAFESPAPQTSHTPMMYGRYMSAVVREMPQHKDPALRKLVDTAFARGIVEMERERKRDPLNELIYIQQARVALLAASYYGLNQYYQYAIATLRKAVELNPRRMQPRMVLAYALMMGGQYDDARGQLLQAKSIYAESGQIYYYTAHLNSLQKNYVAASAALDTANALSYRGDWNVYGAIADALEKEEKYAEAAHVIEGYLRSRVGTYRPEGSGVLRIERRGHEAQLLARLPILWARAGDIGRLRASLNNYVLADWGVKPQVEKFLVAYNRGDISAWIKAGTLSPRAAPQAGAPLLR